ncbi:A-kinase anchor protein 2 isoform X3 [Alosa alosa]|uniref:A-kinase anchor protein 2 isoform X3 n=1 Tax=Alosa alosa TaxID=278164 RepID=UPI0020151727|nr:A-kinase anchor protein 2 isoform X3 [Alosa alosa]
MEDSTLNSEMAEAELHKERLQALAEKRKRQSEIEDKRQQLDDLVLQLQHLRSKAMRERWLLQGTPVGSQDQEDSQRRQVEQDERHAKQLEEAVHRLESEISLLENEESQISAKEQVLRERLRETERSIEDLQKSLQYHDGDAVNYVRSQIPSLPELNSKASATAPGNEQLTRKPALYAMEISVEKDRKTGGTKILSASPVSPEDVQPQRGVKVFDDGHKVIYEVRSGASTTLENGVHAWNATDVDELMQRVGQSHHRGDTGRVMVTPAEPEVPPPGLSELTMHKEVKLDTGKTGKMGTAMDQPQIQDEVTEAPEATSEKPVTMIFMGYHNVMDEDETKKLLGFDGTIKAEIVLIDEDDEKSLREKTVTDISTMDGNAADLVSGRPLSDSTELSSEGKEESVATKDLPATAGSALDAGMPSAGNGTLPGLKSSKPPEDDSELKRERNLKSVSFLDSVSVISGGKDNMELETQSESQNCHTGAGQNGTAHQGQTMDTEVAQEIRYLDEVLEANCCDPAVDMTSNGTSSPEPRSINVDGNGPSVEVSDASPPTNHGVVVERRMQSTFVGEDRDNTKPNGHSVVVTQDDKMLGKQPLTTIKKEARFELRSFQEEKKPSKLFDAPAEKEIRVKKVRPSEEIAELEKERLELIRGQAVKKNPGIAAKWWNPPQERTLEEELDPEKLESHRKYEERKQRKMESSRATQASPNPTAPSPTSSYTPPPEPVSKEDIVTEQVDFSAARKQFLQMEHTKQPAAGPKRGVAPQLYSAKPFSRVSEVAHVERPGGYVTITSQGSHGLDERCDVTTVKTERIFCSPGDSPSQSMAENERKDSVKAWNEESDFTCAHAVMTLVKDEEPEMFQVQRSSNSSYHPEEIDSGLDDLSVRSQDTTVLETLSNDFSMDNVSDSGASNETMSAYLENSLGDYSFPSTPMATTPINGKSEKGTKSPDNHSVSLSYQVDSLTEEELEYHAGVLVQSAIEQAIAQQNDEWEPRQATQQSSPIPERRVEVVEPAPQPREPPVSPVPAPTASPRVPTPVEEKRSAATSPTITVPSAPRVSSMPSSPTPAHTPAPTPAPAPAPAHAAGPTHVGPYKPPSPSPPPSEKQEFSYFSKYSETPAPGPTHVGPYKSPSPSPPPSEKQEFSYFSKYSETPASGPTNVGPYKPPSPSPPPSEKQEFSYFSKYSEAAELRSTASVLKNQDVEVTAGPFKLRSRKQRTLSMIEEEIRAAQEREEELKRQRQTRCVRPQPAASHKQKTNSLPAKLVLPGKTAPGKIEKIRPVPPASPCSSEGPLPSPLSDLGSDDSGGSQRPKNLMQTLMEDFESHKVKRREKVEDNSYARLKLASGVTSEVLEATRVTRRKSNMALKWEAGMYANLEDGEEEEEE